MPNRLIKDSICTSESVDKLTAFQETFFYRLIVNCDDFGRMDARLDILASKLYPLRRTMPTAKIKDALQALVKQGMVDTYEIDGKPYLQMRTWNKHQQIRAKKSKYPAPDSRQPADDGNGNHLISDDIKCTRNPIQSNTESNTNPNPIQTRTREDEQDPGFTSFWNAYPRKSGDIRQAFMAYLHATMDLGADPEKLVEAIKAQTDGITVEDIQFMPSAEKWLRNKGWESKGTYKRVQKEDKPKQVTTAAEYKAPAPTMSAAEIMKLVDKI